MIWFIAGLVIGVSLGMLLMSILVISKQSEERAEQMRRENNIIND
jgi:MFS superfamily sulfate permease-like transporter